MDIAVRKTGPYVAEDHSWLASAHGTEATRTITLDISTFTQATHYPNGYIRSGTVLGQITASGMFGPYDNAAADGRGVAAGFLWGSTLVTGPTAPDQPAALMEHGAVNVANLPANHGLDAPGRTDMAGRVIFR